MPRTITVEVLIPWLEEHGVSEAQIDAIESELQDRLGLELTFEEGSAAVIHLGRVIEALAAIPKADLTEDAGHADLIESLLKALAESGVKFWMIGADTLPLEG